MQKGWNENANQSHIGKSGFVNFEAQLKVAPPHLDKDIIYLG